MCSTIKKPKYKAGFTLIELSIVLVIIGLIVGGILVGQDLIKAAEIRAQISQMEKLNTAVNTFRGKYSDLPGDIAAAKVTQFGFTAATGRAGNAGTGNGDGIINAYSFTNTNTYGWGLSGENLWFFEDLTANSGLIEGNFNTASNAGISVSNNSGFSPYLPKAKIGNGNYIIVFTVNSINYYEIVSPYAAGGDSSDSANPGLSVIQASTIDKKIDDGIPTSGSVLATGSVSFTGNASCNNIGGSSGIQGYFLPASCFSTVSASSTTCYDTTSGQYSLSQNNGSGINCALSFKFQ